jgi:DNA-binding MurR/RpiR family transcriptional regulator
MNGRLVGALFSELEARLPSLPRKQNALARTILESPELIAFGSVRDLSSQLGMNNATVIRFAKSLGFSGYQELQTEVQEAYLTRAGLRNVRAETPGGDSNPVADTFAQQVTNLEIARQQFTDVDIDAVATAFLEAERIVVITTGSAVIPGLMLVRLLRHIGLRGELASGSAADQMIALYDISARDVVIGIGLWLTFDDTVRALTLARRKQARTIAIVGSATSPLGKLADVTIFAPAQGSSLTFSVVATLAVVEAVVASVARRIPGARQSTEQELHDLYLAEDLLAPAFPSEKK